MNINFFKYGLIAFASIAMIGSVNAAEEVDIDINGTIGKFVSITTSATSATVDLESAYDQETGILAEEDFALADIGAKSNSGDGYSISVSTTNGFQMLDSDGVSVDYTLRLNGADKLPDYGTPTTTVANGDTIMDVTSGGTFTENLMTNAHLVLKTEGETDFTLNNGVFTDSIKLSILAK